MVGLFPNPDEALMTSRTRFCESLAITFSSLANHTDSESMQNVLATIAVRNPEVRSIGIRRSGAGALIDINNHFKEWSLPADSTSTLNEMVVPINAGNELWGAVEVRFEKPERPFYLSMLPGPEFALAIFVGGMLVVAYYLYLRKVLRQLNPSNVIPNRVREALDSLSEGLLVLDKSERIVLANQAFEESTGHTAESLVGRTINSLSFMNVEKDDSPTEPWKKAIHHGETVPSRLMSLDEEHTRTWAVSSSPIRDEKGANRGALASFKDVTLLENQKQELAGTVEKLQETSEQIREQNRELEWLATRDPLTSCMNRRSFFEKFSDEWQNAKSSNQEMSAFMVDIDYFKSINDNYGHAMGDEVLRQVARILLENERDRDLACRYGGEEFAFLMPDTNMDEAEEVAEKIRAEIGALEFPEFKITASLGVSALSQGPKDPEGLLDQADKCLYVAKRNGRNRVIRWDGALEHIDVDESAISRTKPEDEPESNAADEEEDVTIPFRAVTALVTALAYRDPATAAHSRRVADLCVATGEGLLSLRACYILEIGAMLHDIGKIGIPDSILLKPASLTDAEWEVMHRHDRMGVEIIRASFESRELSAIVQHHHTPYGPGRIDTDEPSGTGIPIGARILAICDAYDAMVSDRVYRKGMTRPQAFAELRRCSGSQFDPELVERFISIVNMRSATDETHITGVTKETALTIGLQIARLSESLDTQNVDSLQQLAHRLQETAVNSEIEPIANKADELQTHILSDSDLLEILHTANELLDLCRSTQKSFLEDAYLSE